MTRARRFMLLMICLIAWGTAIPYAAMAQSTPPQPDVPLADQNLEARARKLMKDVRCVVCQAQSIDESDAGIASDMRRLVRAEIAAGKSDEEIRSYLSDRYGDFVLFRPPFKPATLLLWAGPFILLVLGAGIIIVFFHRRSLPMQAALSAEELRRVEAALQEPVKDVTRPDIGNNA